MLPGFKMHSSLALRFCCNRASGGCCGFLLLGAIVSLGFECVRERTRQRLCVWVCVRVCGKCRSLIGSSLAADIPLRLEQLFNHRLPPFSVWWIFQKIIYYEMRYDIGKVCVDIGLERNEVLIVIYHFFNQFCFLLQILNIDEKRRKNGGSSGSSGSKDGIARVTDEGQSSDRWSKWIIHFFV